MPNKLIKSNKTQIDYKISNNQISTQTSRQVDSYIDFCISSQVNSHARRQIWLHIWNQTHYQVKQNAK